MLNLASGIVQGAGRNMSLDGAIIGEGIYSPRQAARLLGSSPQDVLRWTRGSGPNDPLWRAHYQFLDDTSEISFLDLIELRVVRALRVAGVSLQAIRYAIELAQKRFEIDRPLSTMQFKTDGTEILMNAVERDGELVSLSKKRPGQKVFARLVEQSISGLEFEGSRVRRWRPDQTKHIVIDPERSFGDPILDKLGISTRVLFGEYDRVRDYKYLARLYEVDIAHIRDAVSFEDRLNQPLGRNSGQGLI
jgi:uncharacterized protein (DUF433 family)/DNA-binding transcriptional MerR regulator